jgi:hypothetical protein
VIYLIGSLRNPRVPQVANELRAAGLEVFDEWHGVGPNADSHWRDYELARGRSYREALKGAAARNTFAFDKKWLDHCSSSVMVAPAGRSGHLELGYTIGQGKPGYILFDGEEERWDVMAQFATGLFDSVEELTTALKLQSNQLNPLNPTQEIKWQTIPMAPMETKNTQMEWHIMLGPSGTATYWKRKP